MDETLSPNRLPEESPADAQEARLPSGAVNSLATLAPSPAPAAGGDARAPAGYAIEKELGRGGMGVVYQARSLSLQRPCALKMILSGAHRGGEEIERFRTEAQAIARLQHPGIVQVFEIGEHDGRPFIVLEFCGGGSLEGKLRDNPLKPREAAVLLRSLAGAVQAAHEARVIHRDLKPANVLLTEKGEPKVTDFGLAKKLDEDGATRTGNVMGTPSYMPPEQAEGSKAIGPTADVYSLGAILYECLAGRPPFRAATPLDTLLQVISAEPVPLRQLNHQVPADLETIAHKCLQKDPRKRYASAQALADDLRRYLDGEPIRALPVGAVERAVKWARRRPALAALTVVSVAAVLALLAGGLWFNARLAEQRNEALQEAYKAKNARDFLASMFRVADAEAGEASARRVLEQAEQRIPTAFADQPEFQEALLADIRRLRISSIGGIPIAMLLEVRGTVTVQSPQGGNRQAVAQGLLYAGNRLRLAADAKAQLVFLSDLHKERPKPTSEVTIRRSGCQPADAVLERDNSILMTFVRLPKGTFYVGWGFPTFPGSAKKTDIKEDFEIAVHAVTQGQWEAIMGYNPSGFSRKGNGKNSVLDISDEELKLFPVESVSWDDTQAFIKKLNEKERGRGYLYRLPTEAEWEYSCRGGATSEKECSYHFYLDKPSNDLSSDQANFNGNLPGGKAPTGKYLGRPTRVGSYPPSKLGLCDMHGNVWQWTSSSFNFDRVSRGGSWYDNGQRCWAAVRNGYAPSSRNFNLGFRLARVPRPVPGK